MITKVKRLVLICLVLFFATSAIAVDWTVVTAVQNDGAPYAWGGGCYMYCYKVSMLSNAADASGDWTLSTMLTTAYGAQSADRLMRQLEGTALFWVDYEPGATAPDTEAQITIDKETGALIFDSTVTTAATAEGWAGNIDTTSYAPITDVTLAVGTPGNAKTLNIYLWFLGGNK